MLSSKAAWKHGGLRVRADVIGSIAGQPRGQSGPLRRPRVADHVVRMPRAVPTLPVNTPPASIADDFSLNPTRQRFIAKSRSPVISASTHQYPANRSAIGTPKASASQYAPRIRPSRSSHQLSGRHLRSSASTAQTDATAMAGGLGSMICWGITCQGRFSQPILGMEVMTKFKFRTFWRRSASGAAGIFAPVGWS